MECSGATLLKKWRLEVKSGVDTRANRSTMTKGGRGEAELRLVRHNTGYYPNSIVLNIGGEHRMEVVAA